MIRLQKALIRAQADLDALSIRWALVGGLALAAYVEPRNTRDLDVAIAVAGDRELDRLVFSLKRRGYRENPDESLLMRDDGHVAGIRLVVPEETGAGVVFDLLNATCGIELEVAASASRREVMPGLFVPVASLGHLLAMKVVAGRPKDLEDCRSLLQAMTEADRQVAREALDLIARRGFDRGKDLFVELAKLEAGE